MISFIWASLRGRAARSVALLLGVLTATTGFTVLTGATDTARLEVTGEVDSSAKAAYEILVRPKGTRTVLENERALIRPNSLSGIYGGLTFDDVDKVAAVPGVDVAAPIAMAGYANAGITVDVDVTDLIDKSLDRQVIRLDRTFLADRGLSTVTARPLYVYVTTHEISWPVLENRGTTVRFTGGEELPADQLCDGFAVLEDSAPLCTWVTRAVTSDPMTDRDYTDVQVLRLTRDGRFEQHPPAPASDRAVARLTWHVPLLVAGVDPVAEERLVGLRQALTGGRYLDSTDRTRSDSINRILPVIATDQAYPDNSAIVTMTRTALDRPPPGTSAQDALAMLDGLHGQQLAIRGFTAEQAFADTLAKRGYRPDLIQFMQVGGVRYRTAADGTLIAETIGADPDAWRTPGVRGVAVPWQIDDTGFREIDQVNWNNTSSVFHSTEVVGTFDPRKLATFDPLSRVSMETYQAPEAVGADQRTRDLLGDQALRPNGNPAGYLSSPPMLLTTLEALAETLRETDAPNKDAPISAVRVRVAGVQGFTPTSRERVRIVAEQIAAATEFDVDIVYGSSPAPQTVTLAAGKYQRPELRVTELWTHKGVAAAIVSAVDRKSVVLFALVLIVCALFLTNAVAAGVRDRRAELSTLTALGWPARQVFTAVLGEVAAIGLVAGAGTVLLAAPLGMLLDIRVTWSQALLAVPIALALALLAGAVPAANAARMRPARGLRPAVALLHRTGSPCGPFMLGLANLFRVPGRTLLGASAVAIGTTAATLLGAVTFAFHGAIVGTLLGDAVSLQVRTVDTIAVVATVLLGAFAVADVLYLNIRDRSAELATLRALGWTAAALTRLIAAEGFGIGVLGGAFGAGLGLVGAAWLVGDITTGLVVTAVAAIVAGALSATMAALVPALLVQRIPTARLLAEE
ncbi:FtsX-like permease family protein [Dactylosporangium sp. AC04546]|uniref:FtsX-like permease family protein n=1 Tax=Dactylosporangium sp. AC04546 TaxID=2862460 RepID=UPI001EDF156A|nr:FtsX-like permease family protein [Dactylosporangium sp. AC04546]WVK80508.1 FtsX-like permease family protein [Dactylosporangium sp. AC04546]